MSILKTKLYRPIPPVDAVERSALSRVLQQAAEVSFTLISAPAGFGKSTLISTWLTQCGLPNAWLSLDRGDADLIVFLEYFVSAIQEEYPGACAETLSLARSAVDVTPAELTTSLVNELDALPGEMVLVLDDYHVIDNLVIHELIATIVLHPPRALHLVLCSRADPPLPLARLRAQGKLVELRAAELRFSRGEEADFFERTLGYPLNATTLATLDQYVEGWPVGLRLAALSISRFGDGQDLVAALAQSRGHVLDFLVHEVLSHVDPALEDALVRLAIVDRFCPELYAALCTAGNQSGNQAGEQPAASRLDGQHFVAWLQEANLFLVPLDDAGRWFRFHASFLEVLRKRNRRRYSEADRAEQHRIAGAWFAGAGLIDEALDQAVLAKDFAAQAALVEQARYAVINAEDWARLGRWLSLLPAEYVRRSPGLLLCRAWLMQFEFRLGQVGAVLDEIAAKLHENSPSIPYAERSLMESELAVLRSLVSCWTAQGHESVAYALEALTKAPLEHRFLRGSAYLYYCLGMQMIGKDADGIAQLHAALESEGRVSSTFTTRIMIAVGGSHWMSADLAGALRIAKWGLEVALDRHLMASHSWLCMLMSFVYYQRNDLDAAAGCCNALLEHPIGAHPMALGQTYLTMALIQQARALGVDAQQWVEKAYALALQTGIGPLRQQAKSVQARLHLADGKTAAAKMWARTQSEPVLPIMPVFLDLPKLTLARVLLYDQTEESLRLAADVLREARQFIAKTHNQLHEIELLSLEALLCAATGEASEGERQLARALALAEPGRIVRSFIDLGPELALLLESLARQPNAPEFTKHVLQAFAATQTHPPEESARTPGALTFREQEVLELLCQRLSNKEIAQLLVLSPQTVKSHVHNILEKLQVRGRREVPARAKALGLLPP